MTVELSVRDVRDALSLEAGLEPGGGAARRALGQAFHQTFAGLVSDDPSRGGLRFVYEAAGDDADGKRRLLEHAYATSVGPWLTREQPGLQAESGQVLFLWSAVRALTDWLYDLVAALRASGDGPARWQDAARALRAEVRFECELREPGWREPVRLTGVADAFVDVRRGRRPCVVELKLGGRRPAVDLGQAALYRLLAQRASPDGAPAAVALVRFSPGVEETLFEAPALADAEATLLGVIGRLAGVDGSRPAAPASSSKGPPSRTDAPASSSKGPPPRPTAPASAPKGQPVATAPVAKAPDATPEVVPSTKPSGTMRPRPQGAASGPASAADARYASLGERLQSALREHVPDVQVVGNPAVGPRFVRFELRLGRGGKVDKVKAVAPEVGLRLKLTKQPIVMHAGGRLTVDVERDDPVTLPFAAIRPELEALRRPGGSSCLPIGVDLGGTLHLADLADPSSAHALVAGTTGSGKTEWLRTAIAGLVLTNTPETLRLVLIDPKRVAFSDLRRSPFLWTPSSFWDNGGDADVVELLEALAAEMDRRYGLLAEAGVDHLLEYAAKTGAAMPRLVCFCDEYFALLAQGDGAQEKAVKRLVGVLGAKGRAAGVHLVLATQQPSRKVVSGPIDANIPCRVGLMMANAIDSRMIIQAAGAERLTGRGDLLYKSIGDPVRLQSPYLASDERARVFGGR
ncbi:MAG TPA: FtsK/SpoIIIE domain-containing protein [Polyangiaceae bacterium]|nr:FtsK/SpoIIIE domain-containing protein [Polyangiaceae bacterium]